MILAGYYDAAVSRLLAQQLRATPAAPMRPVQQGARRAGPAHPPAQSALPRAKTA